MKFLYSCIYLLFFLPINTKHIAVIIDPVVDANNQYPISQEPEPVLRAQRAYQPLFNEQVLCVEKTNDGHVKIQCPNIIYGFNEDTKAPLNSLWILNHTIKLLDELPSHIQNALPNPQYGVNDTLVLIKPWNNFSIGTRFVYQPHKNISQHYAIIIPNFEDLTTSIHYVPEKNALIEQKKTTQQARILFVKLINALADQYRPTNKNQKIIPYVWGGCSFIRAHDQNDFFIDQDSQKLHRLKHDSTLPYTGFDCSSLIMRMTQIAGLPFPWKTSRVMMQQLLPIHKELDIENGDIIWTPRHVMIISDKEKNEVIQARGYQSGYGYIYRSTLSELFVGITTYKDLLYCYLNNIPVQYINNIGKPTGTAVEVRLLKLT